MSNYEELQKVLNDALKQAAEGKGKERHAKDMPFHKQRMQGISDLLGSDRGMAYQAIKKITEGLDLDDIRRESELLGAINYIAGIIVYYRKQEKNEPVTKYIRG